MFPHQLLLNLGFFNRNKQSFLLCSCAELGLEVIYREFTAAFRKESDESKENKGRDELSSTPTRRNQLCWTLLLSVATADPKNLLQPKEKFLWVSQKDENNKKKKFKKKSEKKLP